MMGYKFRRQRPIDNYIVDFILFLLWKLIIEVDGITHEIDENIIRDEKRDEKRISELGYTTLRFSSWEVLNRIADVSISIIGVW